MSSFSALVSPVTLLKPAPATLAAKAPMSADETTRRAAIKKTATDYEASFLSTMLGEMFQGVDTPSPFGGGEGEAAYKSFMTEAYAKQMAKGGGIGVAAAVQREMLKMQGLS
ncbi:MAG TPA: rod-binding protein [Caulobacteraceae bacterium]|jgi:Rod binding domain-containing protein